MTVPCIVRDTFPIKNPRPLQSLSPKPLNLKPSKPQALMPLHILKYPLVQRRLLSLMSEPESVSMIQPGGWVLKTVGNIGIRYGNMGIMDNKMETTIIYWGYIGIMEKEMESTVVYWGYNRIMEKKMESTIICVF